MSVSSDLRTWVTIDRNALEHNLKEFLRMIPEKTRFMAVVKSNAYGHGLAGVARVLSAIPDFNKKGWFGVDSIVEALRLRQEGITNQILVLGYTLPARMEEAALHGISLTISQSASLHALGKLKKRPQFHLKIDTGMHRQGFLPRELPALITFIARAKLSPEGIYTHFAAAKDMNDPEYTFLQLGQFQDALNLFEMRGIKPSVRHAAASGATLLFPETHLDMVRVGMGLYGYWPSPESKATHEKKVKLHSVLAWKTLVSELKIIPKGSYVGYDLTEQTTRKTKIAVLPVGYWHGYDRGFSNAGNVLIRGNIARVLGRVSMDMIVVDVTDIHGVRLNDEVILVGGLETGPVDASLLASLIQTTPYELLTRINPLIKRILV